MEHCPSGNFSANAAWLCCAVLAHNLMRWTASLGDLVEEHETLVVARTLRTRYFAVPGRLVNRSGRPTLRMPERWPWALRFSAGTRQSARRRLRPYLSDNPADRRGRRRTSSR